jgi:hypothetical protein
MNKLAVLSVVGSLAGAVFVAGIAVGKSIVPPPKFVAVEELKWDDVGGQKLGQITGDYKKGAYSGLMKLSAGFTSPFHSHTGSYEAVEIQGTTTHWVRGEDGTKAKKMTPGSYWSMPGKTEHVSSCAPGIDCIWYIWQKSKFDVVPAKDEGAVGSAAAGSPAKPTTGPVQKPAAGAAAGAATAKPATGAAAAKSQAGSAAPAKK